MHTFAAVSVQGPKPNTSKEERKARKKAEHAKKAKEEGAAKPKNKLAEDTEEFCPRVKSVKSRVRELAQRGINPHKAAKMAAAEVVGEAGVRPGCVGCVVLSDAKASVLSAANVSPVIHTLE